MTADWNNFLIAEAGAAAALAGLIFVAISINLQKIIEYPGVSGRAAEALSLLIGILLIATFGLAPNQSQKLLGIEILAVGLLLWAMTTIYFIRGMMLIRHRRRPWWWLATRSLLSEFAALPFCIAGMLLAAGHSRGMYWLIPGCVFSFIASTTSAWVLLIEIQR